MLPTNPLSYDTLTEEQYSTINQQLGKLDTLDVLRWAYDTFDDELVYSCSFGAEGIVLIDLLSRVRKDAKIIFLDTHLHFKETYDLIERVKERYPTLQVQIIEPELSLSEQAQQYGEQLWLRNPNLCCQLRKVAPLAKALTGAKAWMSGVRRDQSSTRAQLQYVNRDDKFRSIKICPLLHWTWDEIWSYIRSFNLTYNVLHDRNYPSIGCEPCTSPVSDHEDSRAGRWAGSDKTECGLHL